MLPSYAISIVLVLGAAPGSTSVAVVALDRETSSRQLQNVEEDLGRSQGQVLSPSEALRRLTGKTQARAVTRSQMTTLLERAEQHVLGFGTDEALEVLDSAVALFEGAFRPSPEVRAAAARALEVKVGLLLDDGRTAAAKQAAGRLLLGFPEYDVSRRARLNDQTRRFLATARGDARGASARVTIHSDEAGKVFVDGRAVGQVAKGGSITAVLAAERPHRVWVVAPDDRQSLPTPVWVTETGGSVRVFVDVDNRLHFRPHLRLECASSCAADLIDLGKRLGVTDVIGATARGESVKGPFDIVQIDVGAGTTQRSVWPTPPAPPPVRPRVTPQPRRHPTVAVVPPLPSGTDESWIGFVLGDFLTSCLLTHRPERGRDSESAPRLPGVYGWYDTVNALRSSGARLAAPLSARQVRALRASRDVNHVFLGTYQLQDAAQVVVLSWEIAGHGTSAKGRLKIPLSRMGVEVKRLAATVREAIADESAEVAHGHCGNTYGLEAVKAYGTGLQLLAEAGFSSSTVKGSVARQLRTTVRQAGQAFAKAEGLHPGFAEARALRGVTAALLGDNGEAEKHFVSSLAATTGEILPVAGLGLFRMYVNTGREYEGAQTMRSIVRLHPGFLTGLELLTESYLRAGKLQEARSVLDMYEAVNPSSGWLTRKQKEAGG